MPAPSSSSPEMLHQRIRLIAAPTWVLVVVLLGTMAAVLLWGVFGTVLVQVSGRGLLVHADSRQIPVFAVENARLVKTHVSAGDPVKAGQTLFELGSPSLDLQLDLAKQRLADLESVLDAISTNADKMASEQERIAKRQLSALDNQRAQLQKQSEFYTKEVSALEGLQKDGGATTQKVEAMRVKRDDADLQLARTQAQRAQIESKLVQSRFALQRRKMDARLAVDEQRSTVRKLEQQQARASGIEAKQDGFVNEILVDEGQRVAAGAKLAVLGTGKAGYEILAFFEPLDGKRLTTGMDADIVPSTVKREEYGTMEGAVASVSARPVSLKQASELLGNETLARYLSGDDPPVVSRITVATRAGAPDQFVWRNGAGPPFSVTPGTVADVEITVQSQAPITLVLPYLKTLVGL